MFVSQASAADGRDVSSYGLRKQVEVVKNCRTVKKQDLKYNAATPIIRVDPDTLVSLSPKSVLTACEPSTDMQDKAVSCEGTELKSKPADSLPMTKQSFLF
jgi:urease